MTKKILFHSPKETELDEVSLSIDTREKTICVPEITSSAKKESEACCHCKVLSSQLSKGKRKSTLSHQDNCINDKKESMSQEVPSIRDDCFSSINVSKTNLPRLNKKKRARVVPNFMIEDEFGNVTTQSEEELSEAKKKNKRSTSSFFGRNKIFSVSFPKRYSEESKEFKKSYREWFSDRFVFFC